MNAAQKYPAYMYALSSDEKVIKRLVRDYTEEQAAIEAGFVDSHSKLSEAKVQKSFVSAGVSQAEVDAVIAASEALSDENTKLKAELAEAVKANAGLVEENASLRSQLNEAMDLLKDEEPEQPKSKPKGKK